jgi:hypothetical protein
MNHLILDTERGRKDKKEEDREDDERGDSFYLKKSPKGHKRLSFISQKEKLKRNHSPTRIPSPVKRESNNDTKDGDNNILVSNIYAP